MRLPVPPLTLPLRPMTRIVTLCLVALLATSLLAPASGASRKLALGVSMLKDRDIATYDLFKKESGGRAPAVWSIWSDWGSTTTGELPLTFMEHLKANGTVPIILWQPVNPVSMWDRSYSYSKIANTTVHDAYIQKFVDQVRQYNGRVLIRFAHEFDGNWFPWGIGKPGNSVKAFKNAWRKIHRMFNDRDTGARKARFIWSPQGSKGASWMKQVFPGKSYVDYIGFTAFNWAGYKRLEWRSLSNVVSRRLRLFKDLPRKPFIVAETGTHYRPGSKAKWLTDGYEAVYRKWPRIVAISYFNVDMRQTGDPKHPENWSLDRPTDGSPMKAYRALLRKSKFRGSIP